jgi:tRNA pseudouridine55 synthase
MNGILIVDKPEGLTSAEVVRRVKRLCQVKVGHLGTLDPFASGVLPLCLGEATKIARFLNTAGKTYEGIIQLGQSTNTGDRTGEITRRSPVPPFGSAELRNVENRFTGDYRQVPPMYSALKRDGVPLYRLARKGVEVERESRTVRIHSLRLWQVPSDRLRFEVSCSKGTYVRVLAEDIGEALGTAAHLKTLRRTRFGAFELSQAVDLVTWCPGAPGGFLSIQQALAHLPFVQLDARAAAGVRRGQRWILERISLPTDNEQIVLLDVLGEPVAVVVREAGRWTFARVLAEGPGKGE